MTNDKLTPETFYNELADDYDDMTRFAARLDRERERLAGLVERFDIESCVDAACGTGLHAVALAQLGVRVIGADLSAAMLERARTNAAAAGVDIAWRRTSFADLDRHVDRPVDALLCIGNSIPHVLTPEELGASLHSFKEVLTPGGICLIQLLNYDRVLRRRERIVGAHRQGDLEFVRFYDFLDRNVRFNMLRLRWDGDRAEPELQTTTLHPYTRAELQTALETAGFADVQAGTGLDIDPFDVETANDLVLVSRARGGQRHTSD